jgi:integrase
MSLSPVAARNAAPRDKPYKLADSDGLALLVNSNGSKYWRFRYHHMGKEKMLTLGPYPAISLADARTRRDEAKKLLANGVDPSAQRKQTKIEARKAKENTFGLIAAEFIATMKANRAAEATVTKTTWLLENLAKPLSDRPLAEIIPAEVLDVLRRVEKTGRRESAHRLRGVIGSVFRYAIITQRATSDPTQVLRGALLRPLVQNRAAIIDEEKLGHLLRSIDTYDGWPTIAAALKFLALTFARPGEVRAARRSEIDFEKAVWRIPAERMKMRRAHDVPLSRQAIAVLKDVWPLSEFGELIFPSIRSVRRPLSENAFNSALRRMGFGPDEMTAHGFRATASRDCQESCVRGRLHHHA